MKKVLSLAAALCLSSLPALAQDVGGVATTTVSPGVVGVAVAEAVIAQNRGASVNEPVDVSGEVITPVSPNLESDAAGGVGPVEIAIVTLFAAALLTSNSSSTTTTTTTTTN